MFRSAVCILFEIYLIVNYNSICPFYYLIYVHINFYLTLLIDDFFLHKIELRVR